MPQWAEPPNTGADYVSPALAAVVPCYNAGPALRRVTEGLIGRTASVIIVDDGSTDGFTRKLDDLPIVLRRFPENRGKGYALLEGFRAALSMPAVECVAVVDADGQHDPAELPRLYEAFRQQGADLLIGARQFYGGYVPWASRFGNTVTVVLTGLLLGRRIPDTQSGYRLHSRRLLHHIVNNVAGGRYDTEMEILVAAVRNGFTVTSTPIQTLYERGNPSSHFRKISDSWRIYRRLFRAALRAPRSQ